MFPNSKVLSTVARSLSLFSTRIWLSYVVKPGIPSVILLKMYGQGLKAGSMLTNQIKTSRRPPKAPIMSDTANDSLMSALVFLPLPNINLENMSVHDYILEYRYIFLDFIVFMYVLILLPEKSQNIISSKIT